MGSLRDILLSRKSDINQQIMPLTSEIARMREALSSKLSELADLNAELDQIHSALKAVKETEVKGQLTIMQAVLEVLQDRPDGMTALEILAEINTRYFGGRIVRPSLSPQLSRLKDRDEKIELKGKKWFLRPEEPLLFERRI
jgi:hypothetical protein